MRETEKKKIQNKNQTKQTVRTPRRETKLGEESSRKLYNAKDTQPRSSRTKSLTNSAVSDTSVSTEHSEVYENVVIHYMDDANRSEDAIRGPIGNGNAVEDKDENLEDQSGDFGKEMRQAKRDDSDYDSVKDSSSSQGDSLTADDEKLERETKALKKASKKGSYNLPTSASRAKTDQKSRSSSQKSNSMPKNPMKTNNHTVLAKESSLNSKTSDMKVHPSSETSEGIETKAVEDDDDDDDVFEEALNGVRSTESDDETVATEDNVLEQDRTALKQKVEIMETRIEKLEEELREVAALEISLYSVIPEHGSSAHKVHTPARRLSRLYIHACKQWTRSKRATIAKNTVSGLILVTRTCGNDVARLTFWLSNTVVLREIIAQAFGIAPRTRPANGCIKPTEGNVSSVKLNGHVGGKLVNKTIQSFEDWEETSTFTSALKKIESWIFCRVVESVWWQALTPNMQSPVEDLISQKSIGKLLGPALGDQRQGNFSIELWRNAFQDAFQRLCPVRSAGHECGCLPVVSRTVMERCVARLDVAMFNAILRESANQIPTDPISDPIVDSRVLPIPAGEFSFGSGAQLKNAVGNWSRWFDGNLCMDHVTEDYDSGTYDDHQGLHTEKKCFNLLNELSDLLMLPKDMLMNRSIREEVCPSIILDVIKRILCYFTPDEFCPDPVPGEVLEALNAESFEEQKLAGESSGSFPYSAPAVLYCPPSTRDVSEKVAEAGGKPQLNKNASLVQKTGYTSDEELDDLDSPLTSLIEPMSPSNLSNGKLSLKSKDTTASRGNTRYQLLREVWSL